MTRVEHQMPQVALLGVLWLTISSTALAATIHDNFGPVIPRTSDGGGRFGNDVFGGIEFNREVAQMFQVPVYTSYTVGSLEVGLLKQFGAADRVRLALHHDDQGKPGGVMREYFVEEPINSSHIFNNPASLHRVETDPQTLDAGQVYWVVATAAEPNVLVRSATYSWVANVTGDSTPHMDRRHTGNWLPALRPVSLLLRVTGTPNVVGDYNGNERLDVGDIDVLTRAVQGGEVDEIFDLNGDLVVDGLDRIVWVHDLRRTWFGDADLNGEFGSADLVNVFVAGEYEDDLAGNSTWFTGDWNGDGDFTTADLVLAFQDGGYGQGARVRQVPEPTCQLGFIIVAGLLRFMLVGSKRTARGIRRVSVEVRSEFPPCVQHPQG
jgi:hypothetical protein